MKRRKIVFLVSEAGISLEQSGGAGTHIRGTISGLKTENIVVLPLIAGDILGSAKPAVTNVSAMPKDSVRSIVKRIVPKKLKYLYRDFRRVYEDYKFERRIIGQIKQFAPDAIYERSALFSTCGIRISKKLNVPLILESDGCMPEIVNMDFGLFSVRLANFVEKYKLRKADYVSAYNEFSKPYLAKKFGVPLAKIIVKPLGISVGRIPVNEMEVEELKQKYSLTNKKVVGFVGAISRYHGVDLLVDCASLLHSKDIRDIAIVIVGWSKEAEELKLKAEELNLTNLIFTGRVDKIMIPLYYKMFDVGVIPNSEPTIYPVKVLEYGAYGLCPVVPDYEVFKEIIINRVQGYYFKKNNPSSLADLMIEIFKTDAIKTIAKNWQQKVLADYTWEKGIAKIATVVNNI